MGRLRQRDVLNMRDGRYSGRTSSRNGQCRSDTTGSDRQRGGGPNGKSGVSDECWSAGGRFVDDRLLRNLGSDFDSSRFSNDVLDEI
jgi:hypothetical protein